MLRHYAVCPAHLCAEAVTDDVKGPNVETSYYAARCYAVAGTVHRWIVPIRAKSDLRAHESCYRQHTPLGDYFILKVLWQEACATPGSYSTTHAALRLAAPMNVVLRLERLSIGFRLDGDLGNAVNDQIVHLSKNKRSSLLVHRF